MKKLNIKQKTFIREYLIDLNATKAAIRAGYSEGSAHVTSARLLANPLIGEEIQRLMEKRAKRLELKADDVLEELRKIAFSRITDVLTFGPTGVTIKSSSEISEDAEACLQMISETVTKDGGTIKINLHNKVDALKTILQHLDPSYRIGGSGNPLHLVLSDSKLDETIAEYERQIAELRGEAGENQADQGPKGGAGGATDPA